MPATVVVGGQYGSEGKGKTVAILASQKQSPWLVRCGGPNSGHTVTIDGEDVILRQVPSCAEPHKATFCVSAGCVVDVDILLRELELLGIERDRFIIDPRAVLVTDADRQAEQTELQRIGSTCSGTGAALARRMFRASDVSLAHDSIVLRERCRVETVAPLLHKLLDDGGDVIIEGTQGFGLSLLHGPDYPYVTSRDTTAAGFAMEVGLSPRAVDEIFMVVRTFPIRVGGSSGPFPNEITWADVQRISGAPEITEEYTSVTKRLRRVAHFDMDAVKRACDYNRPTGLAVMGLDRLGNENRGIIEGKGLTNESLAFLKKLEAETGVPIEIAGTGPGTFEVVITNGTHPHTAHV